jgi:Tfp pilus assembly protein PilX
MPEKYYDVTGIIETEVTLRIPAESEEEAKSEFDSCDLCPESTDTVTVLSSNQCGSSIDDVTCVNEDIWEAMGAAEKITFLIDHSVDEADALAWVADEEQNYFYIEEYLEHIEVD